MVRGSLINSSAGTRLFSGKNPNMRGFQDRVILVDAPAHTFDNYRISAAIIADGKNPKDIGTAREYIGYEMLAQFAARLVALGMVDDARFFSTDSHTVLERGIYRFTPNASGLSLAVQNGASNQCVAMLPRLLCLQKGDKLQVILPHVKFSKNDIHPLSQTVLSPIRVLFDAVRPIISYMPILSFDIAAMSLLVNGGKGGGMRALCDTVCHSPSNLLFVASDNLEEYGRLAQTIADSSPQAVSTGSKKDPLQKTRALFAASPQALSIWDEGYKKAVFIYSELARLLSFDALDAVQQASKFGSRIRTMHEDPQVMQNWFESNLWSVCNSISSLPMCDWPFALQYLFDRMPVITESNSLSTLADFKYLRIFFPDVYLFRINRAMYSYPSWSEDAPLASFEVFKAVVSRALQESSGPLKDNYPLQFRVVSGSFEHGKGR